MAKKAAPTMEKDCATAVEATPGVDASTREARAVESRAPAEAMATWAAHHSHAHATPPEARPASEAVAHAATKTVAHATSHASDKGDGTGRIGG